MHGPARHMNACNMKIYNTNVSNTTRDNTQNGKSNYSNLVVSRSVIGVSTLFGFSSNSSLFMVVYCVLSFILFFSFAVGKLGGVFSFPLVFTFISAFTFTFTFLLLSNQFYVSRFCLACYDIDIKAKSKTFHHQKLATHRRIAVCLSFIFFHSASCVCYIVANKSWIVVL